MPLRSDTAAVDCRVVAEPIDVDRLLHRTPDSTCGAVCSFVGVARDSSSARQGADVTRLEYEAYVPMAEAELQRIACEVLERFASARVSVYHRTGVLAIGDAAVAIVVATPHRAESFDACRYVIEELKARVPIWKKEVFDDGAEWVDPRP